jgi:hypothetical protein
MLFGASFAQAQLVCTAPLNFNSGTFTGAMGATAFSFTPTGGSGNYTFSYMPGAPAVPGYRVVNRPNVPVFFAASATGGMIGIAEAPGSWPTTIRLKDNASNATCDKSVTITIRALDIGGGAFSGYGVGDTVDFRLWGTGGTAPYTLTFDSGTLPPGLGLSQNGLSGTLTQAGTFNFNLKVADSGGTPTFSKGYGITVSPLRLDIPSRNLPNGNLNLSYFQALTAKTGNVACGSCTFSLVSGNALPSGLFISANGDISGTPSVATFGQPFTISITDGVNTIFRRLSIAILPVVAQPLRMTSNLIRDANIGYNGTPTWVNAAGGLPPYTFSIEPGGTLPPETRMLPTSASGPDWDAQSGALWTTARALGDFNFTIRVTDSAGNTATRTYDWRITSVGNFYQFLPPFNGPVPFLGSPYVQPTLFAGGTPPYTVSSVDIPRGLSIDADGLVTGTPQESGFNLNFDFLVSDSSVPKKTFFNDADIDINSSSPVTLSMTAGVFTALRGGLFTLSLSASGSPLATPDYRTTIVQGTLPPGFVLIDRDGFNTGTNQNLSGQISGMPSTLGDYSLLLRTEDDAGNFTQRVLTIRITELTFVNAALASGTVGVPYTQSIDVRGGTLPYKFSLTTGSLPTGLFFNTTTGAITGTPTTTYSVGVGIRVTDAGGNYLDRFYTLNVYSLEITTPNLLLTAYVGEPYSVTFNVNPSGSYTFTGGNGTTGLLLNSSTGVLSGAPLAPVNNTTITITAGTASTVVTKSFTFSAVNRSSTGVLTGPTSFSVVAGVPASLAITPSGGTPPYTVSLVPPSTLPAGLAIVPAESVLGTSGFGRFLLAGVATTPGTSISKMEFRDAAGLSIQNDVTITVTDASSQLVVVPSLPVGLVGVPYSAQLYALGGTGSYTFSSSVASLGPLFGNSTLDAVFPGLTMSSNGVISGTPQTTGSLSFFYQITNGGSDTRTLLATLTINAVPQRRIDYSFTVAGEPALGKGYTLSMCPSGGGGTHFWSLLSAPLPPGLQMQIGAALACPTNVNSAMITGVPTVSGTFTFLARVDDSTGNFGIRQMVAFVTPFRFGPANLPLTLGSSMPPMQVGQPYTFAQTTYNNSTPVTYNPIFLSAPSGLTADDPSGVIAGTPSGLTNFAAVYFVSDTLGNTRGVNRNATTFPAGTPIGVNGLTIATLDSATVGIPYSFNLNDLLFPGFGKGPFSWTVSSGSPPAGLSIVGNVLTGTPTVLGSTTFSAKVTDANGTQHVVPIITIPVSPLSISPSPGILPPAAVGLPYSRSFAAAGGTPGFTFYTAVGSDMPIGMSLSPTGVLSGVPTTWGPFLLQIIAEDSVGQLLQQRYTLNVAPAGTVLPAISPTPDSISLTYVVGNPLPAAIPVNVASASSNFAFTTESAGGSWLGVSAGGSTPKGITVTINPAGLSEGVYNGVVTFTSIAAVNSPLSIPVTLTVLNSVPCSFGLNPASTSVATAGSKPSFGVATNCRWNASTSDPWITVDTPVNEVTGNGTVSLTVQANPSSTPRTGTVTVQGATFNLTYTVNQFGTACAFTISPSSINVPVGGGATPIQVSASATDCAWAFGATDSWVSGSASAPLSGSKTATVNVSNNIAPLGQPPFPSRIGHITIAGQTLEVKQAGGGCIFTLSSPATTVSYSGTTGGPIEVSIKATSGCLWSVDPGPSWVSVAGGASGIGNNTFQKVQLSIAANSSTNSRVAGVLLGGQSFQITQSGVPCSFSVGLDTPTLPPSGGTGKVTVSADNGCNWLASSNVPWLPLSSNGGTGSDTINFNVGANPDGMTRTATVTVAGQTLTINQPAACEYTLPSDPAVVPAGGGTLNVHVVAPGGCGWSASSLALFMTGSTSSSGTNDATFTVAPNATGADRVGVLNIAGQTYQVTQTKASCSITLTSSSATAGEFGGTGSFTYNTAVPDCPQNVQSFTSWLTVTSTSYGGTLGTVNFSVAANGFAATRSGVIKVGNSEFTVTQDPSTCAYSLTTFSRTWGRLGGTDEIPVSFTPAGCGPPPVLINAPFGMITPGPVTSSPGVHTQSYDVGIYQSFINYIRSGQLWIGGQIFTVKQKSYVD